MRRPTSIAGKPTKPKKEPSPEDINNETLNIKISPSKNKDKVTPPKHKKESPDLTTKSTHDTKKTIIIRDSSCGSHCGSCSNMQ